MKVNSPQIPVWLVLSTPMSSFSTVTILRDYFFHLSLAVDILADVCSKHSLYLLHKHFMGSLQHKLQHCLDIEDASYFSVAQISALVASVCAGNEVLFFFCLSMKVQQYWTVMHSLVEHTMGHSRRAPKIISALIRFERETWMLL